MLFFQCLGTLNNVQKNINKIGSKYGRIAAVWKKGVGYEYAYMYTAGLEKKFEYLACPSDKQLSNVACPGQVLVDFLDLVGRQLAWALTFRAREDEK